ncbi:C40 family peptidase [Aquimarina agarivorans]|uniref:C40 family peptidase n=1 Tax=Aquimarina agarivorans TaxID=980584 RepID=UPI000248E928|nr:C40 family peptidase [Aquimarina agarivorans]
MKKLLFGLCCVLLATSCGGAKIPNFDDEPEVENKTEFKGVLPIQKKYASILGIPVSEANSVKLYKFIDSWEGTRYLMGGENKSGIDCSFFSQFLYHDVYGFLIERTADKQFLSPTTDKFIGQEHLNEGDLIFFNLTGSQYDPITHVGVYLTNGKFVHSTSRRAANGKNGVQISDLQNKHWQKLFVSAGRKVNLEQINK